MFDEKIILSSPAAIPSVFVCYITPCCQIAYVAWADSTQLHSKAGAVNIKNFYLITMIGV